MVFETWVLGRHFLQTNKMNLSCQGKQLVVFVADDKIQKTPIFPMAQAIIFQYFSDEIGGDINK